MSLFFEETYGRFIYFGIGLLILAANVLVASYQVWKKQPQAVVGIIFGLVCAPLAGYALAIGACMLGGC